jgi:hypothetical protein
MTKDLLSPGLVVRIVVSDPFELTERAIEAEVVTSGIAADAPDKLSVLFRAHEPIQFHGRSWEYLVGRSAVAMRDLSDLATNVIVDAAIVAVPNARVTATNPLDLSWWRGGLAIRGSVSKKELKP